MDEIAIEEGIRGHVDLMVLAWWGGMNLWDVCVFSAWIV